MLVMGSFLMVFALAVCLFLFVWLVAKKWQWKQASATEKPSVRKAKAQAAALSAQAARQFIVSFMEKDLSGDGSPCSLVLELEEKPTNGTAPTNLSCTIYKQRWDFKQWLGLRKGQTVVLEFAPASHYDQRLGDFAEAKPETYLTPRPV